MAVYTINPEFKGIEVTFDGKPAESIREELKKAGFRWHGAKKLWYARETAERLALAQKITGDTATTAAATEKEPANKYGVQVGDIFSASWGWEQTNNDFFQVVALVGSSSVRVREVCPPITKSTPVSGMSEDRTYSITRDILPPKPYSVFIKDQEHGDVKRLKSYMADGVSNPLFKLSSYADAYYCAPGEHKAYESWYY